MRKIIGGIILLFILTVVFIAPVRNYLNNLFHKDSKSDFEEELTIGTVSGYNPRIQEIQEILKNSGIFTGKIDGLMGIKTREALKEFQKTKALKPTGKIDRETLSVLNRERQAVRQSPKIVSETSSSLNQSSDSGLKPNNSKVTPEDARKKIELQEEIISYRLKSKDRIRQIQTALNKAGFYKGTIDGKDGPKTRAAIKSFQKAKGLSPDGVVGQKTWELLNKYLDR